MNEDSLPPGASSAYFRVVRSYIRLPLKPGGVERHIASLSRAQRRLGIPVVNIFNQGLPEGEAIPVLSQFDLSRLRPAFLRNMLFYQAAYRSVGRLATRRPTVLHIHGDYSDLLFSRSLARRINAQVVAATLHGAVRQNCRWLYRAALTDCKLVFATGKREQLFLEELLERAVYHLPSAPRDVFFDSSDSAKAKSVDIVAVSNLFRNKRLDLLVDCAAARPMYRFAVFGDGPERESLTQLVTSRKLSNIIFHGSSSEQEVRDSMRGARMFISLSETEGSPTAMLEAMAVGLPVVITPSNDYSWLIDMGVQGFVTSSWAVAEILNRCDLILSDESLARKMGQAAHDRAVEHSWTSKADLVTRLMGNYLLS